MPKTSFCALFLGAALAAFASRAATGPSFLDIARQPESVLVVTETATNQLAAEASGQWSGSGLRVTTRRSGSGLQVELAAPEAACRELVLRWKGALPAGWRCLGDAWERAYGELEWKPLPGSGVMPWYFLFSHGAETHGYGVKTGPGSLCYWTADGEGITLHADVRSGCQGVRLGKRTLEVCTVVCRQGKPGESAFEAARAFCKQMCPRPRLPEQPVYGFNDWYCTYGHDTAEEFLANTAYVVAQSPRGRNRPFAVVDDGWQIKEDLGGTNGPGPWVRTNPKFSPTLTMPEFVRQVKAAGARPGVWVRPLQSSPDQPRAWRLARHPSALDPTVPEVRAYVRQMMRRMTDWGFELIKHDFSTFELCGKWGNQVSDSLFHGSWTFADNSRTTAEVVLDLYRDIREGAGSRTLILGCNTLGHLSAGIFELQRIGDDTSGNDWSRTRMMGVNCLAFRAPQHGTFFAVDGDCAGQTRADSVPWAKNSQWLDLLARSGTPLFVSFPRQSVNPDQELALKAALKVAAGAQPLGEPLDWFDGRTPSQWQLGREKVSYTW
jgi:alpha-galactosidase